MHMAFCETVNSSPEPLTPGMTYLGIHYNNLTISFKAMNNIRVPCDARP